MGLLSGKVAIITGAGRGIGRCHALAFAAEGARVVVNDLGGARDGEGISTSAADEVVREIKAAGGEAVANYDSVATREGATAIIQSALDAFGRADILVNNAGILRDKTLLKLDESNWELVIAVHLKDTFFCGLAFAAQVLACTRQWELADDDPRINPNGGAIALGHPLGMTGTRILHTAALELHKQEKRYALVTMCIGVGQGYATIIERA